MKFDMNKAWSDALALFGRNREVVLVVGGIFFLLPDLAVSLIFPGLIAQAALDFEAAMMVTDASQLVITPAMQQALMLSLVLGLVKLFGIAALLSHLSDTGRPTLGEAIGNAARGLPSLIGAVLLFVAGYILLAFLLGLVGGLFALLIGIAAASGLTTIVLFGLMFTIMVRLSMTLPVIFLDRQWNPLAALKLSWGLTAKGWPALLGFYLLLAIGYAALAWVIGAMALPLMREGFGGGTAASAGVGLVGSLLEAIVAALFTCILAAAYRQFSGPSSGNLEQTFD